MASAKHDLMSRLLPPEQQGTEMGNVNAAGQSSNDSPARILSSSIVRPEQTCKKKVSNCDCAIIKGAKCKGKKHPKAVPSTLLQNSNA